MLLQSDLLTYTLIYDSVLSLVPNPSIEAWKSAWLGLQIMFCNKTSQAPTRSEQTWSWRRKEPSRLSPGQCTSKTKELKTDPVVVVVAALVTSPPLISAVISCSSLSLRPDWISSTPGSLQQRLRLASSRCSHLTTQLSHDCLTRSEQKAVVWTGLKKTIQKFLKYFKSVGCNYRTPTKALLNTCCQRTVKHTHTHHDIVQHQPNCWYCIFGCCKLFSGVCHTGFHFTFLPCCH